VRRFETVESAQAQYYAFRHSIAAVVRHSRRTTLKSELLIVRPPLYSMNPSVRNLFMKKLTRDRVVPIISASVS